MNPPVCYLTLVSSTLFYLSNIRSSKKSVSTCWSVLTDFCHYLHLLLIDSFLGYFWEIEIFEGIATVDCVFSESFAVLKLNPRVYCILNTLMLLMKEKFQV